MRRFTTLLAVLAILLMSVVPALAQDDPGTIVDVAAGNEDFSTLVAAVQAAGLVDALSNPDASLTVFAPTNAAFDAALASLGMTAEELLANTDLLTSVLLYHVVEGAVPAADVVTLDGQSVTTLGGEAVDVAVSGDGVVLNGSVNVVTTDIMASNGIIHVIDGVLLPPMGDEDMMEDDMMEPITHIRVHHFSPDAPAVDIYVNGEIAVGELAFPTSTSWLNIPAGTYEIAVAPAGTSLDDAVIGPASFDLAADTWYNVAAVGSVADGTLAPAIFVEDLGADLAEDSAHVTVFHGIEGAPAVDVLAGGDAIVPQLAFPGTSGDNDGAFTFDVPAGTYDLSVVVSSDPDTQLFDLSGTTLEAGMTYLVAAVGTLDAPQIAMLSVDIDAMMADMMGESEDEMMAPTIADIVVESANSDMPEFTTLLAAVDAAGLVQTLSDPEASFTVFAPTDAAFAAALDALGLTAEELLADTDLLTSVLLYHVLDGATYAETVVTLDGQSVATLNGAEISIAIVDGGVVLNDSVNVIDTDIEASNGVIHVIDAVLLPPSE